MFLVEEYITQPKLQVGERQGSLFLLKSISQICPFMWDLTTDIGCYGNSSSGSSGMLSPFMSLIGQLPEALSASDSFLQSKLGGAITTLPQTCESNDEYLHRVELRLIAKTRAMGAIEAT